MRKLVLMALMVSACNSSSSAPDGGGDDDDAGDGGSTLTCLQLQQRLGMAIDTTSHQCDTPADCEVVGNALDFSGTPTCNEGLPFASNCSGAGVNRAAWNASAEIQALLQDWYTRCVPMGNQSGAQTWFDCGRGNAACTNNVCTVAPFDCFHPVDAGVAP